MSLHKLTYLTDGLFQLDSESIPVDGATVAQLAKTAGMDDAQALAWLETLKSGGSGELAVEANKGVIVDMYEVEYPAPVDPLKETEQLASHLDEKNDFVGQQLFPGSTTKDVLVGLRTDLLKTTPDQRKPTTPAREAKKVEAFNPIPELSMQDKQYTLRTGRIDHKKLQEYFGLGLDNWADMAATTPGGQRMLIAPDVFRYIIAVEDEIGVEQYSVDYLDIVERGGNPYDLPGLHRFVQWGAADEVTKGTTLDTLIEEGDEPVQKLSILQRRAFETIDEVPGYTEKSWGGFGTGRVERGDVLVDGTNENPRFFRFIQPISYKQLTIGQVYGDSYSAVNRGYDIMQFLGFGTDEGVKYQSVGELFAKYGVHSLAALEEKRSGSRRTDDTYMWILDPIDGRTGGWYYISQGRWCRGSGAEPLTFWQVEEVVLSEEGQKKWKAMQQRRRRANQQPTWCQVLING